MKQPDHPSESGSSEFPDLSIPIMWEKSGTNDIYG